ncbi:hypothetical protein [Paracoccus sp. ME4]|uniref:hypothetical protein n=1 Tax=Paracoccus sp. ME4 TaxID=3138066 RepID=UPI00398A763D
MTKTRQNAGPALNVAFDQLSKGIDRILDRWPSGQRPTKLRLLNDLAAAIRPGSDWGALKAATNTVSAPAAGMNTGFIPYPPKDSLTATARLTAVEADEDRLSLSDLSENARPLFGMTHQGERILGLDLTLSDGNGFCQASIYPRLILFRDGAIRSVRAFADELEAEAARLIFGAVQDVQSVPLSPIMSQAGGCDLRVLLGPCRAVGVFPKPYHGVEDPDLSGMGLRVLFDEDDVPDPADLDILLRLASAALPHLDLQQYPADRSIHFRLIQPMQDVWRPSRFDRPSTLEDRPVYLIPKIGQWVEWGHKLLDPGFLDHGSLGEALDLALALIGIDDRDVFLRARMTPEPKRHRGARAARPGWRGGLAADWEVLRLPEAGEARTLVLDGDTAGRLARALNGWAIREGYAVLDEAGDAGVEALIPRNERRATHHLAQVRAIMEGADPGDAR